MPRVTVPDRPIRHTTDTGLDRVPAKLDCLAGPPVVRGYRAEASGTAPLQGGVCRGEPRSRDGYLGAECSRTVD